MRASPGMQLDDDGNMIFDGEAEATGTPPFKTRAEIGANSRSRINSAVQRLRCAWRATGLPCAAVLYARHRYGQCAVRINSCGNPADIMPSKAGASGSGKAEH
jgi:hypothetical protein